MRRVFALLSLVLLTFALASCSDPGVSLKAPPEPGSPKQHIATAESTLTVFGAALAAGDSAKVSALAGEHFALVEDGHAYNVESTIAAARAALADGQVTRVPGEMHSHVKGRVLWTHYPVTVTVEGAKGATTFERIETAVLERGDDETWQVMLMSSMPAEKK
jgi:hypothetical protein